MISIWKLTISTFRLDIPKFSKISLTIAVDRNVVIKLLNRGKSSAEILKRLYMNRSTIWKIVKKLQRDQKHSWPTRARKKMEYPLPSTYQKHEEKAATKPSPKLQPLAHRSWYEQIHHAPDVDGRSGRWSPSRCCIARSLRPIMWPWGTKNAGKSFRRWPTARCRTSCSRTRRNSTSSRWQTSKMTKFVLPRHPQRRGSSPDAKICSLSWFCFGRPSQRPGGSLCFLCPMESN